MGQVDPASPSLLPNWSIGHVLTHLARNADSMVRRLNGAIEGLVLDQYPGGADGRDAEIEAGADRSLAALVDDVRRASEVADKAFAKAPDHVWERMTRNVRGADLPVSELPFRRWREVEAHLLDLGIGPVDGVFSDALLRRWLPSLLRGAPDRADPRQLLTWLLRRGPAPDLEPY